MAASYSSYPGPLEKVGCGVNIIETTALTKKYHKQKSYRALLRFKQQETLIAVNQVDLQVRRGELFGVLGPNGAGKTTLVKMLCTLILPTSGQALIGGHDVVKETSAVKRLVGLVDNEERSFFWRLSGWQNLEFFATLYGLRGQEAKERINTLLALVGLEAHAHRRFLSYSSGMKQKLAIVRGLLTTPEIILMDEPTRSLDPVSAHELRIFIREKLVNQLGRTVLLVTHRLEEAEAICDRVAIINGGQIIACGPVNTIKDRFTTRQQYSIQVQHLSPQTAQNLQTIPGVMALEVIPATPSSDQILTLELALSDEKKTLPHVIRFIVGHQGDVIHCQAKKLSLEEAFVYLVKENVHHT